MVASLYIACRLICTKLTRVDRACIAWCWVSFWRPLLYYYHEPILVHTQTILGRSLALCMCVPRPLPKRWSFVLADRTLGRNMYISPPTHRNIPSNDPIVLSCPSQFAPDLPSSLRNLPNPLHHRLAYAPYEHRDVLDAWACLGKSDT